MEIRAVGKTDIQVSVIGFGAAPIANLFREVSEQQALETVQAALDQGVTLFDTAPLYGRGLSETRLGKILPDLPRDSYVLSTKVGRTFVEDGSMGFDYSRDGVLRSLDGSLERLQCDRIDIVHIHDPDRHYQEAIEGAYPALDELRRQGVIRAVSVGINQWPMLMDFVRDGDFDCFMLAGRYTLLEQGALPLLDICAQKGIGILLAGVYNTGILATGPVAGAKYQYRDASDEILAQVERLEQTCNRFGVPLKAAALQFPLGHPAISTLVLGWSSPTRIDDNREALEAPIPSELWAALRDEGLIDPGAPVP